MSRLLRRVFTGWRGKLAATVLVALLAAGAALAYYGSTGSGTGSASVGQIDAPTNVVAKASNGSASSGPSPVTITWNAPGADATPTGYTVVRDNGSSQVTVSCSGSPCTDTSVPDGTYTYHVTSLLGTSWTSAAADSNTLTVVNDSTPPTTMISFPSNGSSYNAGSWGSQCEVDTVTGICGSANDASGVALVRLSVQRTSDGFYWNGSSFASSSSESFLNATLDSPSSTSTTWSLPLPASALSDGNSYTIHVQAKDTVGNDSAPAYTSTATFSYDTTAPLVTLTKVNGNTQTFPYSTNVNVTTIGGACGAASGDNSTVNWSVSGGATESGSTSCSSGSWSATLTTALSAEATYTLDATQSDAAGNLGDSGNKSLIVDKTAPVVTLTKVNGSTQTFPYSTNLNVTTVSGSCGSLSGDSSTINVTVTGTASQSGTASCNSNTWTYTMSPALSAAGSYTVTATQGDAASNTGTSGGKSITIDKTAPVVTLTQVNGSTVTFPLTTNHTVTTIGGACGTANGDVATVSWSVSGGATESGSTGCSSGSWTATLTTALSASGSYTVSATQSDAAGNNGSSGSKSITIDKTAPAVTLTSPASGATGIPITPPFSGAAGTAAGDNTTVTLYICTGSQSSCDANSGSRFETLTTTESGGTWSITPTVAQALFTNTTYTAEAAQSDAAGNTGTSTANSFTTTNTFTVSTAGSYTLTVAPHVTSFQFSIKGAGGGGAGAAGAAGGFMSGTINVPDSSSPTTLNVVVGGGGGGESNTGGNGGNGCANGGAGGTHGSTVVGGAGGAATCILTSGNSPIVVVGGGGGSGDSAGGAGGGANTGTNGSVSGSTGGNGGKTSPLTPGAGGNGDGSAGANGGANGSGGSDTHGSGGNGGSGNGTGNSGGGGGGGYASGGGGSGGKNNPSGGGGGGSGYGGGSGSFTVTGVSTSGTGSSGGTAGGSGGAHNGTDGSVTFSGTGVTDPPADPANAGPPPPVSTDTNPPDPTTTDTTTTIDTTTTDTTTTDATTTADTTTTDPTTTTDTTTTDTTATDTTTDPGATDTTSTDAASAPATQGLSTPRELLFFAVLGGSVLGAIALLTMPIPRRRARRRKAG